MKQNDPFVWNIGFEISPTILKFTYDIIYLRILHVYESPIAIKGRVSPFACVYVIN